MRVRTQVSLDSETLRRARERASQLGLSLAAYVRRLLAADLEAPARQVDVSAVFGLGSSGGCDVGPNKDRMIGEAVAAGFG